MVAPSLIPKKTVDKVKKNKRDALKLAKLIKDKLIKDEELTPIYVTEWEDYGIRDLSRARETSIKDLKHAKYQLKALFLRNNITCKVEEHWSNQHLRCRTELVLPHPSQQIVMHEMIQTITERLAR